MKKNWKICCTSNFYAFISFYQKVSMFLQLEFCLIEYILMIENLANRVTFVTPFLTSFNRTKKISIILQHPTAIIVLLPVVSMNHFTRSG